MAGGAGWVMPLPLHRRLVEVLPNCSLRVKGHKEEAKSDRILAHCFEQQLGVHVVDRPEFNSAAPAFYETSRGRQDKPHGYGVPATFHYVGTTDAYLSLFHLLEGAAASVVALQ
jgi:hypothetical protein